MKINEILGKDEQHSLGCMEPKARRLYIRDYVDVFDILWEEPGPKKRQQFRPIGIICVNCGFMRANAAAIVAGGKMRKNYRERMKDFDYSKPPKHEDTHLSRQERRRLAKLRKKRKEKLDKLGIKKQRTVVTHLD